MQTYDTAYACNNAFSEHEEEPSKEFDCKPSNFITEERNIKFKGVMISAKGSTFSLTQPDHIKKLKELDIEHEITTEYIAERHVVRTLQQSAGQMQPILSVLHNRSPTPK